MRDKNLTIRFYRPGDEFQINRLFEEAFHIKRSLEEWRWKFQNNPLGKSSIIVGEIDNKIVAHSATIPIGIKIGDKDFIFYQSLDSMSDPFTDTKLIFPRVFKRLQTEIENMRQVHFGFPNKKAHDLLTTRRMKVRSIGKINIFSAKMSAVLSVNPELEKREFNLSAVEEFDDKFTHLWSELSPAYKIAVIREREYLNWRYVNKPNNNYKIFTLGNSEIKGYIVVKVFENNGRKIGSIVDLFVPRNFVALSSMLENTLVYFNSNKVDLVVCYHRDKYLSQYLLKVGFSAVSDTDSGGMFSQMWLIGSNFCPRVPNEIFLDELNWFIMMGDSDWI